MARLPLLLTRRLKNTGKNIVSYWSAFTSQFPKTPGWSHLFARNLSHVSCTTPLTKSLDHLKRIILRINLPLVLIVNSKKFFFLLYFEETRNVFLYLLFVVVVKSTASAQWLPYTNWTSGGFHGSLQKMITPMARSKEKKGQAAKSLDLMFTRRGLISGTRVFFSLFTIQIFVWIQLDSLLLVYVVLNNCVAIQPSRHPNHWLKQHSKIY